MPAPTIAVEPTRGLQDGQEVLVVGAGGFAGGDALLNQCLAGDTFLGCQPSGYGFGLGPAGGVSGTMMVFEEITTFDDRTVDCRMERCEVLAEFVDVLAGYGQEAAVEISFGPAPPSTPPPAAQPTSAQPRFAG